MEKALSFWRDALGMELHGLRDVPAEKSQVAFLPLPGSEVELAMAAAAALDGEGVAARVVSLPSTDVFDRQDAAYKAGVLGRAPRVAIEAGVTDFWYKYVGLEGAVVGIDTFGESAPAGVLFKHFGFTVWLRKPRRWPRRKPGPRPFIFHSGAMSYDDQGSN